MPSGTVDLVDGAYWTAADGVKSVDLNGTTPGIISQSFTTVPGATYTVTFALAGNQGSPAVKTGSVFADTHNVDDFSFDTTNTTPSKMGWVERTVSFQAESETSTLTFQSTTINTDRGPAIDNVRVSASCPDV